MAGAALCAAPAAAAPPWSEPRVVAGSERPQADRPLLALGARGAGLVGWTVTEDPTTPDSAVDGRLAPVTSNGPAAPEISLDPYDLAAAPATYGATRAILLQSRVTRRMRDGDAAPESRLVVAFARLDGVLGDRRALDRSVALGGADVASNERGDAVASWIERRGSTREHDRLWVATRRPNGRFAIPQVLAATGEITAVDVAVGARGDAVVAYERAPIAGGRARAARVVARARRAGRRFGPAADLGASAGVVELAAAVSQRGRAYVAWGTRDAGDDARLPWRVSVAMRPAGLRPFGAAHVLDRGDEAAVPAGGVSIAVAADQSATIAWSGIVRDGERLTSPVRTATSDRRGTFGAATPVAGAAGGVGGLVTAPSGATTVLYTAEGEAAVVMAATRSAGAPGFGPPETVSTAPPAPDAAPSLALDPRDGRLLAAWIGAGPTGVLTSSRPPG
jgi:hypothetical protein